MFCVVMHQGRRAKSRHNRMPLHEVTVAAMRRAIPTGMFGQFISADTRARSRHFMVAMCPTVYLRACNGGQTD